MFSIFYSWQSDLPGNKTRHFIRECIDEAIGFLDDTDAIEATRDEATSGLTGSPNIVTSIYSKIDNCDLFIADLSLCFTENSQHEKKSPNPNVLIELGYAAHVIGWDRIICVCNEDYGRQIPFDIAHNRITFYSLEGKNKADVKLFLIKIIVKNIRDLKSNLLHAKSGYSAHLIGHYDQSLQTVVASLEPMDITKKKEYLSTNTELLEQAGRYFKNICRLNRSIQSRQKKTQEIKEHGSDDTYDEMSISSVISQEDIYKALQCHFSLDELYIWKNPTGDKELIRKWLHEEIADDFFEFYELRKSNINFTLNNTLNLSGPDDEIEKHDQLILLSKCLAQLEMRTNYLSTFEDTFFFPIAIQNVSSSQDDDIRVVLQLQAGTPIVPQAKLIAASCEGLEDFLCKDDDDSNDMGIIQELFALHEDGIIHLENAPIDYNSFHHRIPVPNMYGGFSNPPKDGRDYEAELKTYIATPSGNDYYEFDFSLLRPNEIKWFPFGLLIRPNKGKVVIDYRIHSRNTQGDISGKLEWQCE